MTTLKMLPLILLLLSTTSKALEVRPENFPSPIRCSENPTYRSLNLLHDVAILGSADQGLTEDDVLRWTKLKEVKRGGDFQATGALFCYKKIQQKWTNGSAGIVENKKGELRILATAHQIIEDFDAASRNNEKETSDRCYFIAAEDMWYSLRKKEPCGHLLFDQSKFVKCTINKGLAYKLSQSKQIMADYGEDLAILKFEGKTPKVKPLNVMKFDKNMSLGEDKKGEFVKIKGQKYRVWLSSGGTGRSAKRSCLIFNKEKSSPLVRSTIYKGLVNSLRLTNCQSIEGFSGAPLILKKENSNRLYTSCVLTSHMEANAYGQTFDLKKSSNACHSIDTRALELLEK